MKHSLPACFFLLFGISLGSATSVQAQAQIPHPSLPVISVPQGPVIPSYIDQQERIRRQNAALRQEEEQFNQQSRRQQAQAIIQEAYNDFHKSPLAAEEKRLPAPKNYALPSFEQQAHTRFYRQAAQQLQQMLAGSQPLSLKKAVFLVENAYADHTLSYLDLKPPFNKWSKLVEQNSWPMALR